MVERMDQQQARGLCRTLPYSWTVPPMMIDCCSCNLQPLATRAGANISNVTWIFASSVWRNKRSWRSSIWSLSPRRKKGLFLSSQCFVLSNLGDTEQIECKFGSLCTVIFSWGGGEKRKTKTFPCVTHCFLPITTLKEPEYSNVYQRGTGRLQRGAGLIQNKVRPIRGSPEVDVICLTPS